ncbi:MAG: hypothetical protein QOG64_886, partial [Acidimicrobiaceae bacterium]|nr:hypothetical protein [Acidimicrobiaceae bacterium]
VPPAISSVTGKLRRATRVVAYGFSGALLRPWSPGRPRGGPLPLISAPLRRLCLLVRSLLFGEAVPGDELWLTGTEAGGAVRRLGGVEEWADD